MDAYRGQRLCWRSHLCAHLLLHLFLQIAEWLKVKVYNTRAYSRSHGMLSCNQHSSIKINGPEIQHDGFY